MATTASSEAPARGAMTPVPYRVVSRARETADTWTLLLEPLGPPVSPAPGQFNMLYAFGVGEVPISTSAAPDAGGALVHTIRDVGAVSHALVGSEPGSVVGVRGPYGTLWPVEEARGRDLVIVAGGIGLAPLRPAVYHALAHRDDFAAVCVLVGARTPSDLLFLRELEDWRGRFDVELDVTVDNAGEDWRGRVGVVTQLIPRAPFDPESTVALVCGPEVMMTFTARALLARGVPKEQIFISMERNMRCGLGHCGHCQLGPVLICRDGPVFRYDEMERLMEVHEL
jgi:NAD(P)H-flavin reductase